MKKYRVSSKSHMLMKHERKWRYINISLCTFQINDSYILDKDWVYLLQTKVRYVISNIKPFILKSFSFQFLHAAKRLQVFLLRAFVGRISLIRLDGKKIFQSVKSAWSVLHAELKVSALPPLWGNNKDRRANTWCQYLHLYLIFISVIQIIIQSI